MECKNKEVTQVIRVVLIVVLAFWSFQSFSQNKSYQEIPAEFDRSLWGTECFFLDEFIPDEDAPNKVVRINFHFIQDAQGEKNFTSSDVEFIEHEFELEVNQNRFLNNPAPSDYLEGVNDLSSTRIRFDLRGIYFHQSSEYWDHAIHEPSYEVLNKNFGVNVESELNIYFYSDTEASSAGGMTFVPLNQGEPKTRDDLAIRMHNFYQHKPHFGQGLAHELGHAMGLIHTFPEGGPPGDDGFTDTPPDITWDPANYFCDPFADPNDGCTNNTMSYSGKREYFSPQQIGAMHFCLVSTFIVRYWDPDSYPPSEDLLIEGIVEWDNPKFVNGNISIMPGSEMTIKCGVTMAPSSKITVYPGGRLIIDGGGIYAANKKNWDCIEVLGDPSKSQYPHMNQGYVEIINGACISEANVGVVTYKRKNGQYIPGYEGGIVQVDNAIFKNNLMSIGIHDNNMKEKSSQCYFRNLRILLDEYVKENGAFPTHQLFIADCDLVRINGLYIENYNPYIKELGYHKMGVGLYVLNSSVAINAESEPKEGYIANMEYGIKVLNFNPNKTVSINELDFKLNKYSMYLSGVPNAKVTSNTITLTFVGDFMFNDVLYTGLYLDNCTGYQVEDNFFISLVDYNPSSNEKRGVGITVNNSGDDLNTLYRNKFNRNYIGILAQGNNRSDVFGNGLKIKCNTFTSCFQDIKVTPNVSAAGVSVLQGYKDSKTAPAGNRFSKNNNSNAVSDFNNVNNYSPLLYFHHMGDEDVNVWVPKFLTSATVGRYQTQYAYEYDKVCPSTLGSVTVGEMLAEKDKWGRMVDVESFELKKLLDGGNGSALELAVSTAMPNDVDEIKCELLRNSPNLSEQVLLATIENDLTFDEAVLAEILILNPFSAKCDAVMKALEERSDLLQKQVQEQIEIGINALSPMEDLEAKRSHYLHAKRITEYALLHKYKIEDADFLSEEYLSVLEDMDVPFAGYVWAFEQLYHGNVSAAEEELSDIPGRFSFNTTQLSDHADYLSLFNVLKDLVEKQKRINELDDLQIRDLEILASEQRNIANVYARNILWALDADLTEPSFMISGEHESFFVKNLFLNNSVNDEAVRVFPNPTNSYVNLMVNRGASEEVKSVFVYDISGHLVLHDAFSGVENRISLNELDDGVYAIEIRSLTWSQCEKLVVCK